MLFMLGDASVAAVCTVIVAAIQVGGQMWTNRRVREVHDCLDRHMEESRNAHMTTQEKVATVAVTDDARDIRNVGPQAIISGETHHEP